MCGRAVRLTGNFSIVGRAIVVHDAPTNTRLACGNIVALDTVPASWTSTAGPSGTAAAIKPSTTTVSASATSGAAPAQSGLRSSVLLALAGVATVFVSVL